MNISQLLYLNKPGVYALCNTQGCKIHIAFGTNMLNSVVRLLGDLKKYNKYRNMLQELEQLDLIILETCPGVNSQVLRIKMGEHVQKYEALGFSLYLPYRGLSYKLVVSIGDDYKIYVRARSNHNQVTVLGVFESVRLADEFTMRSYPNGIITELKYSYNKLTKEHYKNEEYGALRK